MAEHKPLKRRNPLGVDVGPKPKQELVKPASDKRIPITSRLGGIGKKMGKLGVASSLLEGIDWARWQTKQAKRRKAGYGPEEGGGIL